METLLGILAILIAAFVFSVVLNPYFWQGFRNSRFWDEQKKAQNKTKDLINPDNEDI